MNQVFFNLVSSNQITTNKIFKSPQVRFQTSITYVHRPYLANYTVVDPYPANCTTRNPHHADCTTSQHPATRKPHDKKPQPRTPHDNKPPPCKPHDKEPPPRNPHNSKPPPHKLNTTNSAYANCTKINPHPANWQTAILQAA